MKRRRIILDLDELDYDAVQQAMTRRQLLGRWAVEGDGGLYPDGDSNLAGLLVAEICRGWEEFLDLPRRPDPEVS